LKCATTTTKMKVAEVRAEPKTIGTADLNASTTMSMLLEWQAQCFIQSKSYEVVQ